MKRNRQRYPEAHLDSENAKDNEESAADQNYVSNGLQRSDQSLNHQLQAWGSANNPGAGTPDTE